MDMGFRMLVLPHYRGLVHTSVFPMEPQKSHTLELKAYNNEQIHFRTKGNSKVDPH